MMEKKLLVESNLVVKSFGFLFFMLVLFLLIKNHFFEGEVPLSLGDKLLFLGLDLFFLISSNFLKILFTEDGWQGMIAVTFFGKVKWVIWKGPFHAWKEYSISLFMNTPPWGINLKVAAAPLLMKGITSYHSL